MRARLLLGAMLALGACAREPARIAAPTVPHGAGFVRIGDLDRSVPIGSWWAALGDETLSGLIAQGMRQAPTLEAAAARLRQARAGVAAAQAGLAPTLGAGLLYAHARVPDGALGGSNGSLDLYDAGFDAQWEIDLWGGKRRERDRARAEARAAEARLADARVALAAEITRAYVALRGQEARAALAARREAMDAQLLDMTQAQREAGTVTQAAVESAEARLGATRAERARIAAEAAVARDALAVLTGAAPGALDGLTAGPIPLPPRTVAVGDPTALLARRPDVRAAEARLMAAHAGIGVAEARRLPQVSFMGMLGLGGTGPGDVFDAGRLSTLALPRLTWNLLDFGRGAAEVRGARAGRDAALADYRGAVLGALQDAEAALARYGAARVEAGNAADALRHARTSADLERMRADGGTIAPAQALEADRATLDAEAAEIARREALTAAYVTVGKALGRGWDVKPD
ncbi:MAG: efflux transporter outer membrane subunit [Sphingomonadales bacterium]|nr:efflux transporter outer membrane subunit [Sphingomonadales bacterium]